MRTRRSRSLDNERASLFKKVKGWRFPSEAKAPFFVCPVSARLKPCPLQSIGMKVCRSIDELFSGFGVLGVWVRRSNGCVVGRGGIGGDRSTLPASFAWNCTVFGTNTDGGRPQYVAAHISAAGDCCAWDFPGAGCTGTLYRATTYGRSSRRLTGGCGFSICASGDVGDDLAGYVRFF